MPDVRSEVPRKLRRRPDWDEGQFLTELAASVALHAHCADDAKPKDEGGSNLDHFDPVLHIDVHEPHYYRSGHSRLTAVIMIDVITWPRESRDPNWTNKVANDLKHFVPDDICQELTGTDGATGKQAKVFVTFIPKASWGMAD